MAKSIFGVGILEGTWSFRATFGRLLDLVYIIFST
jgi:hypothetical protein